MLQYSSEIAATKLKNSFMGCEKDLELIIKKLFNDNKAYAKGLKALLVIPKKDCLDKLSSEEYTRKVNDYSIAKLIQDKYIRYTPKTELEENESIKSYIRINFHSFYESNKNPEFRDVTLAFSIYCHSDCWDLGDYRLRPLKIAGYIDGIINNAQLSGLGKVEFVGCERSDLNYDYSGYTLVYKIVRGGEDNGEADK